MLTCETCMLLCGHGVMANITVVGMTDMHPESGNEHIGGSCRTGDIGASMFSCVAFCGRDSFTGMSSLEGPVGN